MVLRTTYTQYYPTYRYRYYYRYRFRIHSPDCIGVYHVFLALPPGCRWTVSHHFLGSIKRRNRRHFRHADKIVWQSVVAPRGREKLGSARELRARAKRVCFFVWCDKLVSQQVRLSAWGNEAQQQQGRMSLIFSTDQRRNNLEAFGIARYRYSTRGPRIGS